MIGKEEKIKQLCIRLLVCSWLSKKKKKFNIDCSDVCSAKIETCLLADVIFEESYLVKNVLFCIFVLHLEPGAWLQKSENKSQRTPSKVNLLLVLIYLLNSFY